MAKPGLDLQSGQTGFAELKQRLWFVLIAIVVFRLGSFVPSRARTTKVI